MVESCHFQVIYPSAYYPPPALSHVSTNVANIKQKTNCGELSKKLWISKKVWQIFHNFTPFICKEEVIIEAAKMDNWRPVNVSFWQNKQPQPTTAGAIKGRARWSPHFVAIFFRMRIHMSVWKGGYRIFLFILPEMFKCCKSSFPLCCTVIQHWSKTLGEEGPSAKLSSTAISVNCGTHHASSCGECPQVMRKHHDHLNDHENPSENFFRVVFSLLPP